MKRPNLLSSSQEVDQFVTLVKQNTKHRDANQLIRYTPLQYKSYLRDIKTAAGSRQKYDCRGPCSSHRASLKHIQKIPMKEPLEPTQVVPRISSSSYYYTNKCELLSLKEFNILVQRAQSELKRKRQRQDRENQKRLIKTVENTIQSTHKVRLRLTSAVARRIKNFIDH